MAINIENNICEAIEYIVENAVANASFDKTVQATVLSCVDKTIGKYKVKYQDSSFYAYAQTADMVYSAGKSVYVLIPANDMSNNKTILGTVDKMGSNYVPIIEGDNAYEIIGADCIDSVDSFELCSYQCPSTKILYDKNSIDNAIHLNLTSIDTYLKQSEYIICGATFKTALPLEQQFKGNYGVVFELNYSAENSNEIITKQYIVDVNQMLGSPYTLTTPTRQYGIFKIDTNKFIDVNKIYIFAYDFPFSKENMSSDIFITNLELSGAAQKTNEELSTYSLSFITPQGVYFGKGDSAATSREIQAQIKLKGKILDDTQSVKYYWFIENMSIVNNSEKYNSYGGLGWECLNSYNTITSDSQGNALTIEWVPASNTYTVVKEKTLSKETQYKCVAVYGDIVLEKTIKIINYDSQYEVSIESDSGTQFYFDIGNPTLTCKVGGRELIGDEYHYVWAEVDNNNCLTVLTETAEYNNDYNYYKTLYDELKLKVENEEALPTTSQPFLDAYLTEMEKYDKIMRVEDNKLIKVQVNTISNFTTYKCSVFLGTMCLGTAAITLLNTLKTENGYDIVIGNGTQVYKYNENGISPTSTSLVNPQKILPLTAIVYDNNGEILSDEVLKSCELRWIVPKKDTMITIPYSYNDDILLEEEDYIIYSGTTELNYTIANTYNANKTNNVIQLSITYQGMALLEETNLTFLKEGESGTNGTDFTCLIVPNSTENISTYPMIINGQPNFTTIEEHESQWFKLQMWHNGEIIFDDVQSGITFEGKQLDITWSVLANTYATNTQDSSDIIINEQTGECQYTGFNTETTPANIIKCKAVYEGIEYYATLPLITASVSDNYQIQLKNNTGFRHVIYSSDGQRPQYNSTHPFELQITQMINGIEEDISALTINSTYKLSYQWEILGKIYDTTTKQWINKKNLISQSNDKLQSNPQIIEPTDTYDGECVSNALKCVVKQQGNVVARIHIPIHLSLNRYGLSMLNDWDGNSLSLSQDGGYILTPQIGAGKKEDDNSFTGVLMGQVKEPNQKETDTGLMAYCRGVRSMYLSAYDGYALFGKQGSGQITLDPSSDKALLYSHDFWTDYYTETTNKKRNGLPITNYYYDLTQHTYANQSNKGMLIDLTTPRIAFGSGNFRVEPEGYLYARGGGTIGGWDILNYSLAANYEHVGMSSMNNTQREEARVYDIPTADGEKISTAIAFWAGYDKFYVSHDGYVRMNSATIGNGNISNLIYVGQNGSYSSLHSGKKTGLSADENGFYLGTDGFALGKTVDYSDITGNAYTENHSKFEVKKDGTFYAKDGYIKGQIVAESGLIGGWTIQDKYLQGTASDGKYIKINSNGAIVSTDGTNEFWKIDRNGSASFSNVTITGGSVKIGDKIKVTNDGQLTASSVKIEGDIAITSGSIKIGDKFKVTNDGTLTATNADIEGKITASSGKVGNWEISNGKLLSTNDNGHVTGLATSAWPGDPAFYAGGPDPWSDSEWAEKVPFYVTNEGYLKATNARIEGTIKATSGEFDNCTIKSNCSVPASTINGVLSTGNIPEISADKITGGTLDGITISGATIGGSKVSGVSVWGDILSGWALEVGIENKFKVATNGELSTGDSTGKSGSFWIMTGWTESGNGKITFKGRNCTFKNGIIVSISDETTATANT